MQRMRCIFLGNWEVHLVDYQQWDSSATECQWTLEFFLKRCSFVFWELWQKLFRADTLQLRRKATIFSHPEKGCCDFNPWQTRCLTNILSTATMTFLIRTPVRFSFQKITEVCFLLVSRCHKIPCMLEWPHGQPRGEGQDTADWLPNAFHQSGAGWVDRWTWRGTEVLSGLKETRKDKQGYSDSWSNVFWAFVFPHFLFFRQICYQSGCACLKSATRSGNVHSGPLNWCINPAVLSPMITRTIWCIEHDYGWTEGHVQYQRKRALDYKYSNYSTGSGGTKLSPQQELVSETSSWIHTRKLSQNVSWWNQFEKTTSCSLSRQWIKSSSFIWSNL